MILYYILQTASDSLFSTDVEEFSVVATTTPLQFAEAGLAPGTTRYGRVKAVDELGNESGWSNIATATTPTDESSPGEELLGLVFYGDESVYYGDESVAYGTE